MSSIARKIRFRENFCPDWFLSLDEKKRVTQWEKIDTALFLSLGCDSSDVYTYSTSMGCYCLFEASTSPYTTDFQSKNVRKRLSHQTFLRCLHSSFTHLSSPDQSRKIPLQIVHCELDLFVGLAQSVQGLRDDVVLGQKLTLQLALLLAWN